MTNLAVFSFAWSVAISLAGLWAMIGFMRLVPGTIGLTYHLSRMGMWAIGTVVWRTIYWDVWRQSLIWGGTWTDWFEATGRLAPNLFWNITLAIAIYHALRSIHLMIPHEDRSRWRWWLSPAYPLPERRRRQ